MTDTRQLGRLVDVIDRRHKSVEQEIGEARKARARADKEYQACSIAVTAEQGRLDAILAILSNEQKPIASARYAQLLTMRNVVVRDLEREQFTLERAVAERTQAREWLAQCRAKLLLLRLRANRLRDERQRHILDIQLQCEETDANDIETLASVS